MKIKSGVPEVVGVFELNPPEFQYCVYLPILVDKVFYIPEKYSWVELLIENFKESDLENFKYCYLTVKYMFVEGYTNRRGWHIDGFLTDDVNYIWCDVLPTFFSVGEFDLTEDHEKSLKEMEYQSLDNMLVHALEGELRRLDNTNVHCCAVADEPTIRKFVKLSLSNSIYNLEGNAINPLIDNSLFSNKLKRDNHRNHPVKTKSK